MNTHVSRYGYDRYTKHTKNEDRYYIFDRQAGMNTKLATVYDVADAEMIVSALNKAEAK